MLDEPILYLSLYPKQNRRVYYELLQEVRIHGTWETWLEFFLDGVHKSAKQAINTTRLINNLFEQDCKKVQRLERARVSCKQTLEYMKQLPQVTVPLLTNKLSMTAPTARGALNRMVKLDILEEDTEPF